MSATPSHIARYTVVQPIAAGGMGEVFLARDEKLDRLVAIKLLREGFDNDELRARFEEEARNVAKLTHPNIVTIYEYGAHDGRPYIAMEYVAGHSMAELIRHKMPLSVARRVRLIEELCSGLGHAHKAHLVHRDVKPANLMVTTSGTMKVLDFGIAKLRGTDRTQKGMLVGTVNYMSPEQITGKPVDHRSDIFAVGAVLHEVLTYDQAFKGDLTTAMFNIVHGQAEPLAARCPGLDAAFQSVVSRCLAKDPDERYQDLGLLKRELARLRRPLEEDESDAPDTLVSLDADKTIVFRPPTPSSGVEGKAAGPDTRRALGSALASGEAAIASGQFESAVRHAEQALALESSNVSARSLLARATHARDAARMASAIDRAREALGADQIDDARAALVAAAEVAPPSDTVRDLADRVERRAADLARLQQTIVIARQRLDQRDFAQAKNLADTVVVIRPGDSELRRLREQIDQAAAEDARRREEEAQRAADAERANRITSLLDKARRTSGNLMGRRNAVTEVLHLDPENADAAALLAEFDAAIAEDARQRALDDALAAGDVLLEQGHYDLAVAKANDVAEARPGDTRARLLIDAVAAARRKREVITETLARAESLAQSRRWEEAIAALATLDARETGVSTLLARARRERSAEARRRQIAAIGSRLRGFALNRGLWAGAGTAATVTLAVAIWSAQLDLPTVAPPRGSGTALPIYVPGIPQEFDEDTPPPGGALPTKPGEKSPAGPGPATGAAGSTRQGGKGDTEPESGGETKEEPPPRPEVDPNPGPAPGPPEPGAGPKPPGPPIVNPPPEPPAAEKSVELQASETQILGVVGRFTQAFGLGKSAGLGQIKAVWPGIPRETERSYDRTFSSYKSIAWTMQNLSILVNASGQTAVASGRVRVDLEGLRDRRQSTEQRTYQFGLAKQGAAGWVITEVTPLGPSR